MRAQEPTPPTSNAWRPARLLGRGLPTLALIVLAACGGGGGGAATTPSAPPSGAVQLGLAASTVPTTWMRSFHNPLEVPATVGQTTAAASPFAVSPSALPTSVPAGGDVLLPVVLTPTGPGLVEGTVTLRFTAGAAVADASQAFAAQAETVAWGLAPGTLAFASVLPGTHADRSVVVTNQSALSPVTFTSAQLPGAEFTLVGSPWPALIGPGGSTTLTVRYAPTAEGPDLGSMVLGPSDRGGPLQIPVTAGTAAREQITDFGAQTLSGSPSETATLTVDVPADAISLTVEALAGPSDTLGLGLLTGPGNVVYENASLTGAYFWNQGLEVFSATVPNTDRSAVQLVAGGGTYSFRIRRMGGTATSATVRTIVERRPGGTTSGGVLDLNVWLAQGLSVHAAGAPTDTTLQAVLTRIDAILSGQGLRLGAIDYYDVNDATYDYVTDAEFPGLLRLTSAATKTRLNLFFVLEALGNGVVGVAGTISGPLLNGTGVSGVMSVYGGYTTSTVGLVAAHEIGHFVGLYHPVEQSGSYDFMDDTLQCPVSGTNATCPTAGGGYLMHWQAVGGTTITNGQGRVIRGHPLVGPTAVVATKPGSGGSAIALPPLSAEEAQELADLPPHWCGTCQDGAPVTKRGR